MLHIPVHVGITVNKYGDIYVVDDTTIRRIDASGSISTVIGSQSQLVQYAPIPCGRSAELYEVCVEKYPGCSTFARENFWSFLNWNTCICL